MIKNIRFLMGSIIDNTPWLYCIRYIQKRSKKNRLRKGHILCIEGFQRSGNGFLVRTFKKFNKGLQIAHHTHASVQIINATKKNIPAVLLVRNPRDAVASLKTWDDRLSVGVALRAYIRFYRAMLPFLENCVVAEFEVMIHDPNKIILAVNEKFGTSFITSNLSATDLLKFFEQKRRPKNPLRYALPHKQKKLKNEINRQITIDHPLYSKAQSLYERVISN